MLDGSLYAAATWSSKAAGRRGNSSHCHVKAAAAGVGKREDGTTEWRSRFRGPLDRRYVACVHVDHGQVEVRVNAGDTFTGFVGVAG